MGDFIGRNFKKQSARAKEKLLESLGKADRTTDEQFDEQYANFLRQQAAADKLAKHMRNYLASVKAMCQASRAFHDVVREVYEPQWPNREHVNAMTQSLDLLWDDYCEKLQDQVMNPVSSYSTQFSETKLRIDKRGRKLLDYDSARHSLLQMQQSKKTDDAKTARAQDQLTAARDMYATLNAELLEEMPQIYEKRMKLYAHTFQSCYSLSSTLHRETSKIEADLAQYVEELNLAADQYRVQKPAIAAPPHAFPERPKEAPPSTPPISQNGDSNGLSAPAAVKETRSSSAGSHGATSSPAASAPQSPAKEQPKDISYPRLSSTEDQNQQAATVNGTNDADTPEPATKEDAPPVASKPAANKDVNVIKKVRATHKYTAEDTDELSFEAGETITVIAYDDPEEQDEGWLMGVLESTGMKGVFPENFTKPI